MSTQLVTVGVLGMATGFLIQYWLQNINSTYNLDKKVDGESKSDQSGRKRNSKKSDSASTKSTESTKSETDSNDSSDSETDSNSDSDVESEDIDIDSTALNDIPGEVRMSLIVRQDLKMGKGKAAAQCSHATLALYKKMSNAESAAYNPQMLRRWEWGNGQAKITLQVPTQEDMDMLYAQAMEYGINCYIVHDAGRTQIQAGSATVLGLGPAPKPVLDKITSHLKLY